MNPFEVAVPPVEVAKATRQKIEDEAAIAQLAALLPMQYDRARRGEAKRLGVQVLTLDRLVAAARKTNGGGEMFPEVEPWPEPVDGARLLTEIVATIRRYVVCDAPTAQAVALWIVMTWLMDVLNVAPLAVVSSPQKRCGKTQLLAIIDRLAYRALAAGNISAAAVFRAIEQWSPTLIIDEADAFMKQDENLRGLLNAGHTRDTAFVIRTVGDDHVPKRFSVWGPKAIAGIGRLADTLMDRAIVLPMRRKVGSRH
jgi:putative DNA primase/helicase